MKAGTSIKEKCLALVEHWQEGFRFASVGMAFSVFSAALVIDIARMRPPLHRIVVAIRPLFTATILLYTNGGRIVWNGRQWCAMGLLAGAGMVLPLYDWYAGESVYEAFTVVLVAFVEVVMFSGANSFLEHLFSKRQSSTDQKAESPVRRLATDWQQAVYLCLCTSFMAFLIFEAGTPVKMDNLYFYWVNASWLPYITVIAGGCCGVCQILLMRAGGCMAKELALTSVVPLSALLIQTLGSVEVAHEIGMLPIVIAIGLVVAAAALFPALRPVSSSRQAS